MARSCPYERTARTEQEAHGRPRVSNVTMGEPATNTGRKTRRSRISQLRKELRQAELEDALEETEGVLSVVQSREAESVCALGPTVYAPIVVNGVCAKALIDTGSPATIASLQFLLKVFAGQRTPQQTVSQWKEEVYKKFTIPSISLQNYGGHQLDILAQTQLTLSKGDRRAKANVFVQKDAPNELLLGTDVQPLLGFSLMVAGKDGKVADLLSSSESSQRDSRTHSEPPSESSQRDSLTHSEASQRDRHRETH